MNYKLIIALFFVLLAGCSKQENQENYTVYTSIPPFQFFVDELSSHRLNTEVLIPSNIDLHNFSLKTQDLIGLRKTVLYFGVGCHFEEGMEQALRENLPANRYIDLCPTGSDDDEAEHADMDAHEDEDEHEHAEHADDIHSHELETEGEHDHESDYHYWGNIEQMKVVVTQMASVLIDALEEDQPADYQITVSAINENLPLLIEKMNALQQKLSPSPALTHVYFYSSGFSSLSENFPLETRYLATEGQSLNAANLAGFIQDFNDAPNRYLWVQPWEVTDSTTELLASTDNELQVFSLNDYDWLSNIEAILTTMGQDGR